MHRTLFAKSGLSFDRLRVLVEVADAGSIAAAAGGDPVRQSQFSRQLKELEAFFECKLTEHKGRKLVMTTAGRQLADLARDQLNVLARFQAESKQAPLLIRVGAGESLLQWLLIPGLCAIKTVEPPVYWRLENRKTQEIVDRILDQRLDFGLLRNVEETPPLKWCRLGRLSSILCVPGKMASGMSAKPAVAVSQLPMALLEGRSRFRQTIEETCRKLHRIPNIRFECSSQPEIAVIVRNGLAAGILPGLSRREFTGCDVRIVDLGKVAAFNSELYLVWNPRTLDMSARIEALRDDLASALRQAIAQQAAGNH